MLGRVGVYHLPPDGVHGRHCVFDDDMPSEKVIKSVNRKCTSACTCAGCIHRTMREGKRGAMTIAYH